MKWLQDNPLGMALAAASGVFLVLVLGMVITWNLPVSVDEAGTGTEGAGGNETVVAAHQVAAMRDLQVINEKPVFNESRLPVIDDGEAEGESEEGSTVTVKDAPDVKLTGVIITPGMKIASLTPSNETLETVMAHEGQSLIGEFTGWQVSEVKPRSVVLKSSDGQSLALKLQIHDQAIKEPPKPIPAKVARAESEQDGIMVDEDGEPLSRAEQIRQRIAERREELRLEQEAQSDALPDGKRPSASPYQNAIRNMTNNKSKDQGSNDKKDG